MIVANGWLGNCREMGVITRPESTFRARVGHGGKMFPRVRFFRLEK